MRFSPAASSAASLEASSALHGRPRRPMSLRRKSHNLKPRCRGPHPKKRLAEAQQSPPKSLATHPTRPHAPPRSAHDGAQAAPPQPPPTARALAWRAAVRCDAVRSGVARRHSRRRSTGRAADCGAGLWRCGPQLARRGHFEVLDLLSPFLLGENGRASGHRLWRARSRSSGRDRGLISASLVRECCIGTSWFENLVAGLIKTGTEPICPPSQRRAEPAVALTHKSSGHIRGHILLFVPTIF